jgi:uncharacterized membrane protein
MGGRAKDVFVAQVVALCFGAALQTALAQVWGAHGIALGYAISFIGLYLWLIYRLYRTFGVLVLPRILIGGHRL